MNNKRKLSCENTNIISETSKKFLNLYPLHRERIFDQKVCPLEMLRNVKYYCATYFSKFYYDNEKYYSVKDEDTRDLYLANGIKFDKFLKRLLCNHFSSGKTQAHEVVNKTKFEIELDNSTDSNLNTNPTKIVLSGLVDLEIWTNQKDANYEETKISFMEIKWISQDDNFIDVKNPSWMYQFLHYAVMYQKDVLFLVCNSKEIVYKALIKWTPELVEILKKILQNFEKLNINFLNKYKNKETETIKVLDVDIYKIINVQEIEKRICFDFDEYNDILIFIQDNLSKFREYKID